MGLSSTVSKINGDFGRNSQNVPTYPPRVINARAELLPVEFCNGGEARINLGDAPSWRSKKFDTCIRLDTIPRCDGQTDGQTDIVQQYRALYADAR